MRKRRPTVRVRPPGVDGTFMVDGRALPPLPPGNSGCESCGRSLDGVGGNQNEKSACADGYAVFGKEIAPHPQPDAGR
jgi:hypothetical protein